MHLIQKAVLLLAIILVCYFDGRYRIIPNKLIAAIMAIGLATNVIISGWQGLVFSAAGFSAGLLILIIPFLLGGIGAGDVKLLAAIGCLLGPAFAASSFLYGAIIGGIWAVVVLFKQKSLFQSLKAIGYKLMILLAGHKKAAPPLHTFASGKSWGFPYGIAIGFGAAVTLVLGFPF
ncbi:MAG TPA: prepilin peptidase [Firmicutes bacterium]|nr:prepilin peptidase [Bacillota bacterium]